MIDYFEVADATKPINVRFRFDGNDFTIEMPTKEDLLIKVDGYNFKFEKNGPLRITPPIKNGGITF